MKTILISTKEIRNDLEGFLKKLKNGQTFQVMYRSRPIVTLAAKEQLDEFTAKDAGTPAAARRSIKFVKSLPARKPALDPSKSFKELYEETQTL